LRMCGNLDDISARGEGAALIEIAVEADHLMARRAVKQMGTITVPI